MVYERSFGMANIKSGIPVTSETRFNFGSVSKQFTAACILLLEEQGKLDRDDSIQKYIPELPSFGHTITLHHLLAHTSGIPDHLEVLGIQNNYKQNRLYPKTMLAFLTHAPSLSFKPGERFAYCNTGYMLLALVVEKVSGMSLQDFAQKYIFDPLKMNTAIYTFEERLGLPDHTQSYSLRKGKYRVVKHPTPSAMGATGVFGTLHDYIKWNENFKHNILGKGDQSLTDKMQTSYTLNDGYSVNYGTGLILKSYRGNKCMEHSGGWNNFLMQTRRFPDQDLTVCMITNVSDYSFFSIFDQVCNIILPEHIRPSLANTEHPTFKLPLNRLAGIYSDASNIVRRIIVEHDSVKIASYFTANKILAVLHYKYSLGDSLYIFTDQNTDTIVFRMNRLDKVCGFYWEGGHYFRNRRYYESLNDSVTMAEQKGIVGSYYSVELKQHISVVRKKGGTFKMFPTFLLGYTLEHIGGEMYKVKNEPIYLRFKNDELIIGNDWVSGLKLRRIVK
jgi:CubicO group peptidase (beta-lactamase class C family)